MVTILKYKQTYYISQPFHGLPWLIMVYHDICLYLQSQYMRNIGFLEKPGFFSGLEKKPGFYQETYIFVG